VGTEFKFRVVVVFLFAIFYVIINTAAGVRAVDPKAPSTHSIGSGGETPPLHVAPG